MTVTQATARQTLVGEFEAAWRDGAPVFACCRKTIGIAVEGRDVTGLCALGPAQRVHALREPVEKALPGHLESHRCCANHLADLAFDLPELLAPVGTD